MSRHCKIYKSLR